MDDAFNMTAPVTDDAQNLCEPSPPAGGAALLGMVRLPAFTTEGIDPVVIGGAGHLILLTAGWELWDREPAVGARPYLTGRYDEFDAVDAVDSGVRIALQGGRNIRVSAPADDSSRIMDELGRIRSASKPVPAVDSPPSRRGRKRALAALVAVVAVVAGVKRRCLWCGRRLVPVVYGFPGPEMIKAAQEGRVVLGGCVIGFPGKKSCPNDDCRRKRWWPGS